jgi:group I intron endonuclease
MVIYLTTNLINNKQYVGRDSQNRKTYLGSGKFLKAAILKYGVENFKKEILEQLSEDSTIRDLIDREKYWLTKLNCKNDPNFYNLSDNSGGMSFGDKHRPETLIKISKRTSESMTTDPGFIIRFREAISTSLVGRTPWNKGQTVKYKPRKKNVNFEQCDLDKIRELYEAGERVINICKLYGGCSHHTILGIIRKKRPYDK